MTIHDFSGFPDALYRLRYPAPGDPALAARVLELLDGAGVPGRGDARRGLDHGAWVPLLLMFPDAGIPVVQVSVQPALGPPRHLAMGRALRALRDDGILILGSGGATHDLRAFGAHALDAPPVPYAAAFDEWLRDAVEQGREDELLHYVRRAPEAARNHPTVEHFMPLFAPLGAAAPGERGRRIHAAFTYGVISMSAFSWG